MVPMVMGRTDVKVSASKYRGTEKKTETRIRSHQVQNPVCRRPERDALCPDSICEASKKRGNEKIAHQQKSHIQGEEGPEQKGTFFITP